MSEEIFLACAAIAAFIIVRSATREEGYQQQEDFFDAAQTTFDETIGVVSNVFSSGDLQEMVTSQQMKDVLKRREKLSLTRYALGDGGYTWGYGHFSKNPDELPMTINVEMAEAIFEDDVINRAEKWVKLYVSVPLTQNQFDALVSIAFNMSPQSFKKFATAVNAGQGIDDIAAQSIAWVDPKFQNGIRNRRNEELRIFNDGVYA
jgi:lysozyme